MNIIMEAAKYADMAHGGQKRKYSNRPYIEHPGRVAARLTRDSYSSYCGGENLIAAAWLHDVLEDCPDVSHEGLSITFGRQVADLVLEVTNPSKQFPDLPRHARKALDRDHLAGASHGAKIIKLVDRTDNLLDMLGADRDFKQLYLDETRLLYQRALRETSHQLEKEFNEAFDSLQASLDQSLVKES